MSLLDIAPIIEQMLLVSDNVSDLNFSCGQTPQVEISGVLYTVSPMGLGRLSAFQTEMIAMALLRDNADAAMQLAKIRTADLSYALPGKCRFRVNIFQQRNSFSIVMRVIPHEVPSFDSLAIHRSFRICRSETACSSTGRPVRENSTLALYRPHKYDKATIVTIADPTISATTKRARSPVRSV